MKVSVVMATYNGEKYIKEQLDSICNQTYQIDEIIICDDKSTDNTVELIENYTLSNGLQNLITLYKNDVNLGYADNFNRVIGLAEGEYIFFSDQDDIWVADKIQKMVDIMEKNPDCALLCSDYEPFIYGEGAPEIPKKLRKRKVNTGNIERVNVSIENIELRTLGCCMCLRREFRDLTREYWFSGWAQDDRCWKLAQCVNRCLYVNFDLVRHRIHSNNTATYGKYHTVKERVELFEAKYKAAEQMLRMAQKNLIDSDSITIIEKNKQMMKLRIELMRDRKLLNAVKLLFYLRYFQSKKSIVLEVLIALKG